jgi:hypothetical protein
LPPVRVDGLRLRQTDRKLFIFTYGRGIWTTSLPPVTAVSEPGGTGDPGYFKFNNPAGDVLTMSFLKIIPDAVLDVFTVKGELLNSIVLPRSLTFRLDISNYSNGIYLLRIRNGKEVLQCEKMIRCF